MSQFIYDAFISYSQEDKAFAKWLEDSLERYRAPKGIRQKDGSELPKQSLSICRDIHDVAGINLSEAIESAIHDSKYLIVICSPASRKDKNAWVGKEINWYADRYRIPSEPSSDTASETPSQTSSVTDGIITVLLRGRPNSEVRPNEPQDQAFHLFLETFLTDPLAADFRSVKGESYWMLRERRKESLLSILAILFNCHKEDLAQRQQSLDRQRYLTIITILFAAVAGFALLSQYAFTQRDSAIKATRQALDSARVAQDQRKIAYDARQQALDSARAALQQRQQAVIARNYAQTQKVEAEQQKDIAEQRAAIADSRRLASAALLARADRFDFACLVAEKSLATQQTREAEQALLTILTDQAYFSGHLVPPGQAAGRVVFHPTKDLLVAGSKNGIITLVDIKTQTKTSFQSGKEGVRGMAIAPDGNILAVLHNDDSLEIWSMSSQVLLDHTVVGWSGKTEIAAGQVPDKVASKEPPLVFVGNQELLFSGKNQLPVLYHLNNRSSHEFLTVDKIDSKTHVAALAWDSTHRRIAAAIGRQVFIWDYSNPTKPLLTWRTRQDDVASIKFAPSGDVYLLYEHGSLELRTAQGAVLNQMSAHAVSGYQLSVSPNGSLVATTGHESGFPIAAEKPTLCIWDADMLGAAVKQEPLLKQPLPKGYPLSLSFDRTSKHLAVSTTLPTIETWNLSRRSPLFAEVQKLIREPNSPSQFRAGLLDVSGLCDNRLSLVYLRANGTLCWIGNSGEIIKETAASDYHIPGPIKGIAIAQGQVILQARNRLFVINPHTLKKYQLPPQHPDQIIHQTIAAKGRFVVAVTSNNVVGSTNPELTLWDLDNPAAPPVLLEGVPPSQQILTLAWLNGARLVAGTYNPGIVCEWDLSKKGRPHHILLRRDVAVNGLVATSNGQWLYSGHQSGSVMRSAVTAGSFRPSVFIGGGIGELPQLALSQDQSLLAVGDDSGSISLWHTDNAQRVGTVLPLPFLPILKTGDRTPMAKHVAKVIFLASGKKLAALYGNGRVGIWNLDAQQWAHQAHQLAGRSLTRSELRDLNLK